jgi:hypothetical protein
MTEMKYTKQQLKDMAKTERPWKYTLVHRWLKFLCDNKKDDFILDFGCGARATMPKLMRDEGYKWIVGHDIVFETTKRFQGKLEPDYPGQAPGFPGYSPSCKGTAWDFIVASNVMNIQPTKEHIVSTLNTIKSLMDENTTVIVNYPMNPRKVPEVTSGIFKDIVEHTFLITKYKNVSSLGRHGAISLIKPKGLS